MTLSPIFTGWVFLCVNFYTFGHVTIDYQCTCVKCTVYTNKNK